MSFCKNYYSLHYKNMIKRLIKQIFFYVIKQLVKCPKIKWVLSQIFCISVYCTIN